MATECGGAQYIHKFIWKVGGEGREYIYVLM
jgi:hypothetical protein